MLIPRIFHQVWIGPRQIPEEFLVWRERWLELHPGWELKVWNDAAVQSWIQESDAGNGKPFRTRRFYEEFHVPAQKVDLLAVELPHAFGGIYLDSDFEPLKNIEPLIDDVEAFSATEGLDIISGGIMGCVPGHPAFRGIIDALPQSIRTRIGVGINGVTGPGFRTEVFVQHPEVRVLPRELVYPIGWWEKEKLPQPGQSTAELLPDAYALHWWYHSWAGAVNEGASS